jgi:hypothetical protein
MNLSPVNQKIYTFLDKKGWSTLSDHADYEPMSFMTLYPADKPKLCGCVRLQDTTCGWRDSWGLYDSTAHVKQKATHHLDVNFESKETLTQSF